MAAAGVPIKQTPFLATARSDLWWLSWAAYALGLTIFLFAYPIWSCFQGDFYRSGNYLSPFYSPELWGTAKAWIGIGRPAWWPGWIGYSPALLIIAFPAGFRLTCYYYRGAYYKALWQDPPNCTVGEPRHGYRGENFWPLLIQNAHRYFMYVALIYLFLLAHDAYDGFFFTDPKTGQTVYGIGAGTIILVINVVLIWGYTLGCHSLRNWVGGNRNRFSRVPIRAKCWTCVNFFNTRHMNWAWVSLIWVSWTDFYIRMCAMGVFHDFRVLF